MENIILSPNAKIHPDVELICSESGQIIIDDFCHIKKGVVINSYGGIVHIKSKSTIGEYSVLYGHGGIEIGEATAVAPHCTISAQQHIESNQIPLRFTGEVTNGIIIEAGCLIGSHCFVGDNITIGKMTIIGANSTVIRSIPSEVLAVGTPCEVVRKICSNKLYGLKNADA
ncbi:MAG: acyltransferase [Desulfovibrio sp.]